MPAPTRWGSPDGWADLFAGQLAEVRLCDQHADFVHHSTATLFELFKDYSGETSTVLAQLQPAQAQAFTDEWIELAEHYNIATDGTCDIPSAYLQVVAVKNR